MCDIVVINVSYVSIWCYKIGNDVDIIYFKSYYICIKNWFMFGDVYYYCYVLFCS